jgi:hypothetical protein
LQPTFSLVVLIGKFTFAFIAVTVHHNIDGVLAATEAVEHAFRGKIRGLSDLRTILVAALEDEGALTGILRFLIVVLTPLVTATMLFFDPHFPSRAAVPVPSTRQP